MIKTLKTKKTFLKGFRPQIRSRHPSHAPLRRMIDRMPFRSVVRFGSTTDLPDTITNGGSRIEVNTIQAIKNASNKKLMKECFNNSEVPTADWWTYNHGAMRKIYNNGEFNLHGDLQPLEELPYPIVAKHIYGSRGRGNTKIENQEDLETWLVGKTLSNYIFEKFYNYSREYRLHVTADGCFYTCRKMIKSDTPDDQRWFRNDSNSVWILEENEAFDKPVNWDSIVEDSVKALKSVGLDVGAVDLKVQSRFDSKGNIRENPKYIVIEINSAPSFGEITLVKYKEEIPKILKRLKNDN